MKNDCPQCGSAIALETRNRPVWEGTCPNCQREFVLLGSPRGSAPESTDPVGGAPTEEDGETGEDSATVSCNECGGRMSFSSSGPDAVQAVCAGCSREYMFVLARPEAELPAPEPRRGRAPRGEERDFDRPPARPCRQCGGILRFSTGEDGMVTGECSSCGNKFTLPPRRDDGGRRDRRSGGGGPRGSGFGFRRRPSGGPRGGSGGYDRPRRNYSSDPRRRRPRRDDDE